MNLKSTIPYLLFPIVLFLFGCQAKPVEVIELKTYPIDTLDGIISQTGLQMDKEITSDGNGSVRITVEKPTTIKLYETGDIDVEDARLIYRAKVRTQDVAGRVFIEMWCHFPGKGDFFSRALQSPLSGTNEWSTQETPFFLKKGENPDNVKINIVVDGKGIVWIDDIRLLKAAF
jgi:hypothetical protein